MIPTYCGPDTLLLLRSDSSFTAYIYCICWLMLVNSRWFSHGPSWNITNLVGKCTPWMTSSNTSTYTRAIYPFRESFITHRLDSVKLSQHSLFNPCLLHLISPQRPLITTFLTLSAKILWGLLFNILFNSWKKARVLNIYVWISYLKQSIVSHPYSRLTKLKSMIEHLLRALRRSHWLICTRAGSALALHVGCTTRFYWKRSNRLLSDVKRLRWLMRWTTEFVVQR